MENFGKNPLLKPAFKVADKGVEIAENALTSTVKEFFKPFDNNEEE